ncbi:MAG: DUF1273 domain-containing protein [Clostridia bacterium]|nr:DUF1273 domain-containing protein [Clostridia bacterium]
MKSTICCFSGYRPEKMPQNIQEGSAAFANMLQRLRQAICQASDDGYRHFLSGMSRGFDLWAAEIVLELQAQGYAIDLWAAIAYPGMHQYWEPRWQERYNIVLSKAAKIFPVFGQYTQECYTVRDRFLVEQSSRCICFFDGTPGGTAYTVNYARRSGLIIVNLADMQLTFDDSTQ